MQGHVIGPYRLDRELGSGGMGKVYAATVGGRCPGLAEGTRVALKVVHPHLLETPGFFKRFLREAEIGKAVVHENVVRTFDADAVRVAGEDRHYLVMEYVEGRTLRDLLRELDRVPEELCRHIGREVAKGLAAIHAAGAVHRDLKPENVLITADGHTVKVMDLGVARLTDESLRLSQTGAFVGSVQYAAPEQFRAAADVDHRADLHALGLILYELATAQHPYQADDFRQTMRRVLDEAPRRPGEIHPQLSPFLEELVLQLLEKDPARRIASAAELAQILDEGERSAWWKERARAIRAVTKRPMRRIRIPRETALHGREADLAKLRAAYDQAKAGAGQVLLVEGEAGIGKSRLVDEFVGVLAQQGEEVNFLYGSYPPGGAATASGAFSTAYREQFGEDGCAAWLTQTPILVPAFDALLRGEPTPSGAEPLTKDSLQTVFVHATRNLAAERPTIVLIDDLHFAPEEGRALFASLALAVPGHRLLLVGTTRPGLDEKWIGGLTRLGHAARMPLQRLGPKDMVRLLADSLRSQHLAEELAGRIALKSDGNPFFVFEILRGLREGQFLTRKDDGTWATTRVIEDIQVPSSVLDLVNARVADLSEDERNALDVASCLGFEFDPAIVAAVLGVGRIPLLQRLAHVEKAHRLVRSAGRRFVFDHHQVQEALYGALPDMLREEYHAAIGAALETASGAASLDPKAVDGALAVDLAEHFLKGARGGSALRYLDSALAHLGQGHLNDAFVRLAHRALRVPGLVVAGSRCELLLRQAARLDLLGRRDEQAQCIAEARRIADSTADASAIPRILLAEGQCLQSVGRLPAAISAIEDALRHAESAGDSRTLAAAWKAIGMLRAHTGRPEEGLECQQRAAAMYDTLGDAVGSAGATTNIGILLTNLGRTSEAREWLRLGLERTRTAGHARFEAIALIGTAALHHAVGEPEPAREFAEAGMNLARRIGDRRAEAMAANTLANALGGLDRDAEQWAMQERHVAIAREIGDVREEAIGIGNLGISAKSNGRLREAVGLYESALVLHRQVANPEGESTVLGNLGALLLQMGQIAAARDACERALTLAHRIGTKYPEGFWADLRARIAEEEGDADAAERLFAEAIAVRREIADKEGLVSSLLSRGAFRARAGRREAAILDFEESRSIPLASAAGRDAWSGAWLALLGRRGPVDLAGTATADWDERGLGAAELAYILWQATHDPAHLAEAKRLLDDLVAHAPPEYRESMLTNVRLHREIVAACRGVGL